jgi:5'-methylthioadenosine phosphorylase
LNFQEIFMLGIIGGSGLTQLASVDVSHREVVRTPYGEPSGPLTFGRIGGRDVVFVARHGYGHTIPPHLVNYRANIHALETSGVTQIVSVAFAATLAPARWWCRTRSSTTRGAAR